MGYSSNKKFSSLTDDINLVIDGCGNTHEEKYYYGGMYIDLCGLSIESYMENPCCGGNGNSGGGGSGSGETSKPVNEIYVRTFEGEDGFVYYQAFSRYPVTSNIKITVSSTTDNIVTELDLYVGDKESIPERGETTDFVNITLNMKEDDEFQYKPIKEESNPVLKIYTGVLPLNLKGEISEDLSVTEMTKSTTKEIIYSIPPTDVNYNDFETLEEFDDFCIKNQYCFVLLLPKNIYDDKSYILSNYGGSEITKKFTFEKEITLDNVSYAYLVEKAVDDIMPFVPLYGEELSYTYKLTLIK